MKILTIGFGILLILLGFKATWFPIVLGCLVVGLGLVALKNPWRNDFPLFGAIMLAVLTFLSSLRGLWGLYTFLSDGSLKRPAGLVITQSVIAITCLIFAGLGLLLIKNFWHGWKEFGQFLGNWLARVVLTVFYFTVFVPFGLGVRLLADPLHIKAPPIPQRGEKQLEPLWRARSTGDQKLEDVLRQF